MIEIRLEHGNGDRRLSIADSEMPPADEVSFGEAGGQLHSLFPSTTRPARLYYAGVGGMREAVVVIRRGNEEWTHLLEVSEDGELRVVGTPHPSLRILAKSADHVHAEPGQKAVEFFGSKADGGPKAMQRICLVTTELAGPSAPGSIGTFFLSLAHSLRSSGHAVTILYDQGTRCANRDLEHWITELKLDDIELVPLFLPPGTRRMRWPERRSYAAYLWLRERSFDWIHFHELNGCGYYSILAKQQGLAFGSATLCVGLHRPTFLQEEAKLQFLQKVGELDLSYLERRSVEGADVVVSGSRYLVDRVVESGWSVPARTLLLPPPAPPVVTSPERYTSSVPLSEVVFIGGTDRTTGFDLFCQAITRLAESKLAPRKLTFAGPFPDLRLEEAASAVMKYGEQWGVPVEVMNPPDNEIIDYLAQGGRLAVVPECAVRDYYPVMECVGLGIPVIAAARGPIPELLAAEDRARVLFEPTPLGLAEKIHAAFEHTNWTADLAIQPDEATRRWDALHQLRVVAESGQRTIEGASVLAVLCGDGAPGWIRSAIENIAAQSMKPISCLHLSEASPDGDGHAKSPAKLPFPLLRRSAPRAHWGEYLMEEWNRSGAEFAVVIDGLDLLAPRAIELLLEASTRRDAAMVSGVAATFVGDVPAEPLSFLVPIGGAIARGAFEPVLASPIALLRRDLMSRIGSEPLGESGLWSIAVEALLHGRRVEMVPEVLVHHRFDEALTQPDFWPLHRDGTAAFRKTLPRWFGPFLDGLVGTVARSDEKVTTCLSYMSCDPWVAERFAASERVLFRADERTSFGGLEPLQDLVIEERGRSLGFTASSIDPQFEFRWWVPRYEGKIIVRIDLYSPIATQLKLYYTVEDQQLYDESRVAVRALERGRNEEFIVLEERNLNGFFRFDPSTTAGRFALFGLEIRALE